EGQDRADVVRQARNVGYEQIVGELAGGVAAWRAASEELDTIALASVGEPRGTVVDVRQDTEYRTGHLPGAFHVELGSLRPHVLPVGPLSLMCAHGERAMTGASLVARAGRRDLAVLTGRPDASSPR